MSQNRLVSLYIRSCLIGFAAAAGFVALILILNIGNLAHLIGGSPQGWLAAAMLWLFNGIVFAGVQFGIAVMGLARPSGGTPGRAMRQPAAIPVGTGHDGRHRDLDRGATA